MSGIPPGFCRCGCGQPTRIAPRTFSSRGHVKGQPQPYVASHNRNIKLRAGYRAIVRNNAVVLEHVAIAEAALGKPLPLTAEVHHVDENKRNNAHSNLVICQDRAYHRLLHARRRVLKAGGHPDRHRICSKCQTVKPFAEFNRAFGARTGGFQRLCKLCQVTYQSTYIRPEKRDPQVFLSDAEAR